MPVWPSRSTRPRVFTRAIRSLVDRRCWGSVAPMLSKRAANGARGDSLCDGAAADTSVQNTLFRELVPVFTRIGRAAAHDSLLLRGCGVTADVMARTWRLRLRIEALDRLEADATETISYAMPTFDLNGHRLVCFAGYAKHTGFYSIPSGIEALKGTPASPPRCCRGRAYRRGRVNVDPPPRYIPEVLRSRRYIRGVRSISRPRTAASCRSPRVRGCGSGRPNCRSSGSSSHSPSATSRAR
jgi:hypothetical protein